jgi:quercetin dioxygenase-like cupin family protein
MKNTSPDEFTIIGGGMDPRGGMYNDFDMQLFTWDEMPKEQLNDLIGRKMVVGEKAMAAQIFIAKGGVVPEHHHEAEQITYILEGALKFHIEGQDIVVNKGQVLVIPSNVPHSAVALEDTLDLDLFSPLRYDWLNKTDDYLRKK